MTQQFDLNFDAGLIDLHGTLLDCIKASVHSCGRQMKAIAADLDYSPSELSRRLNPGPNDPHFPVERLPELIAATNDLRPVVWPIRAGYRYGNTRRMR